MAKKRMSLAEIAKEDSMAEEYASEKEEIRNNISEKRNNIKHSATIVQSEVDMTKMSITVPTEMFEKLQDISRNRRRVKQPFKLTELAREALSYWLSKQKY